MILNSVLSITMQKDWKNACLEEYLYCVVEGRHFRMIVGASTDSMSGGKIVDGLLEDEHTAFPSVFHDGCYRDTIEESTDGGMTYHKYSPTFDESNRWLKQNIIDAGGDEAEAEIVYLGVQLGGHSSFNEDRGL